MQLRCGRWFGARGAEGAPTPTACTTSSGSTSCGCAHCRSPQADWRTIADCLGATSAPLCEAGVAEDATDTAARRPSAALAVAFRSPTSHWRANAVRSLRRRIGASVRMYCAGSAPRRCPPSPRCADMHTVLTNAAPEVCVPVRCPCNRSCRRCCDADLRCRHAMCYHSYICIEPSLSLLLSL